MNIFILDKNPVRAAKMQCDKHVVKMALESAQMLCLAHNKRGTTNYVIQYVPTHRNHPCTIWARHSISNYEWLYKHFCALLDEYTFRYGKVRKVDEDYRHVLKEVPRRIIKVELTEFQQCMPLSLRSNDVVKSYRNYYIQKSREMEMRWTRRNIPIWYRRDQRTVPMYYSGVRHA